jgi:hypothetical protein
MIRLQKPRLTHFSLTQSSQKRRPGGRRFLVLIVEEVAPLTRASAGHGDRARGATERAVLFAAQPTGSVISVYRPTGANSGGVVHAALWPSNLPLRVARSGSVGRLRRLFCVKFALLSKICYRLFNSKWSAINFTRLPPATYIP